MVRFSTNAIAAEAGGDLFSLAAGERVDDSGDVGCSFIALGQLLRASSVVSSASVCALQPSKKVVVAIFLMRREADLVMQVRSTGGHGERLELRAIQTKDVDHIVSDATGCGGGATDHGDVGELLFKEVKLLEAWAEVMTPFRDTMSFVNGDSGKLFLLVDSAEVSSKVIQHAKLRGDIE